MVWVVLLIGILLSTLKFADEPAVAIDAGGGEGEPESSDADFGLSTQDAEMDDVVIEDIPDESSASDDSADDSAADESSSDEVNVTQTAQDTGFDPSLVDHARRYYSMSDEEIARYGTSERLHAALDGMYQQQVRRGKSDGADEKKDDSFKVDLPTEGDDAFDERLVGQFRSMADQINELKSQVSANRQQSEQAQQANTARQVAQAEVQMDGFIDKVSDDFPGYFGKGRTSGMAANSEERANRVALFGRAVALASVLQSQPGGLPSEKEILTQAAYSLFGSKLGDGPVRNNGRSTPDRSQHVNRPTNRQTKPQTQSAAAYADNFMREKGFDPDDDGDEIGL